MMMLLPLNCVAICWIYTAMWSIKRGCGHLAQMSHYLTINHGEGVDKEMAFRELTLECISQLGMRDL